MPAGDVQCTMVFTERLTGKSMGWSEEHFHMTAGTLEAAANDLFTLARARTRLLGIGVELTGLKISDVTVWRDSRLQVPFTYRVVSGLPVYNPAFRTLAFWQADFAYASLLARLEGAGPPLYRRAHWISGNPDGAQDITTRDSRSTPAWNDAWDTYRELLVPPHGGAPKWGFRVKSRDPATTFETLIDAIEPASGALMFVNLPAAFAPGKWVVIRNVRGLTPRIAGTYLITGRALVGGITTITLDHVGTAGDGAPLDGEYTGTGLVRLLVPLTVGYKTVLIRRFGKKNVGGPSGRARGRRKTVVPAI